jgi:hypothetical protein
MVYVSSLVGGILLNLSIAIMAVMQGMYQGEECREARKYMAFGAAAGVVLASVMVVLLWLGPPGAIFASILAGGSLIAMAGVNIYATYRTGITDCAKARMYSMILGVIFAIMGVMVWLLTPFL